MNTAYVYKWTHIPTLKWYIGSRTSKNAHPDDGYICSSKYVLEQIKLQPEDWKREIIALGSPESMYELETEILQMFDAKHDVFSFNKHNNTSGYSFFKSRLYATTETRKKRSDSLKKTLANPELRKKYSELAKGRKISESHKHLISESMKGNQHGKGKGKPLDEERKQQTSIAIANKWKDEEYRAKVVASQNRPDVKQKRSESIKKSRTPEVLKRIGDAHRGKKTSDAAKEKMRLAKLGKPRKVTILTCPHCAKIGADSQMKRWHFDNCKYNMNKTCLSDEYKIRLQKEANTDTVLFIENILRFE